MLSCAWAPWGQSRVQGPRSVCPAHSADIGKDKTSWCWLCGDVLAFTCAAMYCTARSPCFCPQATKGPCKGGRGRWVQPVCGDGLLLTTCSQRALPSRQRAASPGSLRPDEISSTRKEEINKKKNNPGKRAQTTEAKSRAVGCLSQPRRMVAQGTRACPQPGRASKLSTPW